jgi:hypothetical protein
MTLNKKDKKQTPEQYKETGFCDEILENMKSCLHRCDNNMQVFNVSPFIFENTDINKCENINRFKLDLEATKTRVYIKSPILKPFSRYSMEYNVNKRKLILKEFCDDSICS